MENSGKKLLSIGCHFDSAHGIYIGKHVQELAIEFGWSEDKAILNPDDENYTEAWIGAEGYLGGFTPEGHYFGSLEDDGSWGVWEYEEGELT